MRANIDKQTCLADRAASIIRPTRSVTVIEQNYSADSPITVPPHRQAQLLCPLNALTVVHTATDYCVVPPRHAAWIPPGLEHKIEVVVGGKVLVASIEPTSSDLPALPRVICLPALLQELLIGIAQLPRSNAPSPREGRLLDVLADELISPAAASFNLPLPKDPRLHSVCTRLLAHPANPNTATHWAAQVGITAKTLNTLFRRETGLTFVQWRQRVRLFLQSNASRADQPSKPPLWRAGTPAQASSQRSSASFSGKSQASLRTAPIVVPQTYLPTAVRVAQAKVVPSDLRSTGRC